MNILVEYWRGLAAQMGWFAGAPLANLRLLRTTRTRPEAQAFVAQRAQRTLASCGFVVEVDGPVPPPGTGCVVVYNECSFADVFAFTAVMLPHLERSSAAAVFGWIPFMKEACRRTGIALVPRGSRTGVDRVLAEMVAAVRAGERISWGGEGRQSGRDAVLRFKVGASLIAIRAGAPLVPVAFRGGHAAMALGSIRARPGTIRVRFGAPIETAGLGEDDARALADRAQAAVAEMFAALGAPALEQSGRATFSS